MTDHASHIAIAVLVGAFLGVALAAVLKDIEEGRRGPPDAP